MRKSGETLCLLVEKTSDMTIGCSDQVDVVWAAPVSSVTKVSVLRSFMRHWCLSCGIPAESKLYSISIASRCMRTSVDDLSLQRHPLLA